MTRYAKGRHAVAECQRSGQKMRYRDLVEDGHVPGLLVHPDWWEPKHPQEIPVKVDDPIALRRPAPEISVESGYGNPEFPIADTEVELLTGAHELVPNNVFLVDQSNPFGNTDSLIGNLIRNLTDGSEAMIYGNNSNTVSGSLAGGTDNDWDIGDLYQIVTPTVPIGPSRPFVVATTLATSATVGSYSVAINTALTYQIGQWVFIETDTTNIYFASRIVSETDSPAFSIPFTTAFAGTASAGNDVFIEDWPL